MLFSIFTSYLLLSSNPILYLKWPASFDLCFELEDEEDDFELLFTLDDSFDFFENEKEFL